MNGYNFSDQVRKALQAARKESARLDHEYVGTEHLLLGLLRQEQSVAVAVLVHLEVPFANLKTAVESKLPKGRANSQGGDVPYTDRARKVLELAMTEARELHHDYVGTEHLLLGLIREKTGPAAQVLQSFGVDSANARAEVLRLVGAGSGYSVSEGLIAPQSPSGGGYNFTDRVRKTLQMAREEAARLHHDFVGPEHVLLGVLREGSGVAVASLHRLGVIPDAVRAKLEQTMPLGKHPSGGPDLPYTARAKKVLELALTEARELEHSYVGTEHLLLGILGQKSTAAAQALVASGASLESVRKAIVELVESGSEDSR